jgi:hypothetical protein
MRLIRQCGNLQLHEAPHDLSALFPSFIYTDMIVQGRKGEGIFMGKSADNQLTIS